MTRVIVRMSFITCDDHRPLLQGWLRPLPEDEAVSLMEILGSCDICRYTAGRITTE